MKVILPGSYDPVTLGHLEIIKRAAEEFDEVFVVAFINPKKNYKFTLEDRVAMLMLATAELDNVLVSYSDGLVIDYMREHNIDKIVKGYRNESDLLWEKEQAEYNKKFGGYDTLLWKCDKGFENISSTAVREGIAGKGEWKALLPEKVANYIKSL